LSTYVFYFTSTFDYYGTVFFSITVLGVLLFRLVKIEVPPNLAFKAQSTLFS